MNWAAKKQARSKIFSLFYLYLLEEISLPWEQIVTLAAFQEPCKVF